jgi:hypothetical protein
MEKNITIEAVNVPEDFKNIVEKANLMLRKLKKMDKNSVFEEIRLLNVPVSKAPSVQQINEEMLKVQSAKDRVSDILIDAHTNFVITKRIHELLLDGWTIFSDQNSAERRRGEAGLKMYQFAEMAAESEAIYKATSHVLKNLDSKHDMLSRQVTIFTVLIKLDPSGNFSGYNSRERELANITSRRTSDDLDDNKEDDRDNDEENGKHIDNDSVNKSPSKGQDEWDWNNLA